MRSATLLVLLIAVALVSAGRYNEKRKNRKPKFKESVREAQAEGPPGSEVLPKLEELNRTDLIKVVRLLSESNAELTVKVLQQLDKNLAILDKISSKLDSSNKNADAAVTVPPVTSSSSAKAAEIVSTTPLAPSTTLAAAKEAAEPAAPADKTLADMEKKEEQGSTTAAPAEVTSESAAPKPVARSKKVKGRKPYESDYSK